MAVIDIKAHPAFARREAAQTQASASELEVSLIKGIATNVALIERSLQRFKDAPSPESFQHIVNTRITLSTLLRNLQSEETEWMFASDSFIDQYALLRGKLEQLHEDLERAAASYQPPAPQPVQIVFNVQPEPKAVNWIAVAILVAIMSVLTGVFL